MVGVEFDVLELSGVGLHRITEIECVAHVRGALAEGHGGWIITPNLDIVRQCHEDPEIGALVSSADLRVADGMPLIWASRMLGRPLPERVCGSNLIYTLSEMAAAAGRSIYLLGGADNTAERTAEILRERYPGLRVVGTYSPPMGFERDDAQYAHMHGELAERAPDIVFVALGFPKAERLIARLRASRPTAWWIGVGISFSFVCGDLPRAPQWMQDRGLEWLHRMSHEPDRLFRRYVIQDAPFAVRFFVDALRRKAR